MSQEDKFWHQAWEDGRTRFHLSEYNTNLVKFFPSYSFKQKNSCLVPLCGKTLDMHFLADHFENVVGVDIVKMPLEQFFSDHQINSHEEPKNKSINGRNITLYERDFLNDNLAELKQFDFIYDRASLVAIEPKLRPKYVQQIKNFFHQDTILHLATFEREIHGGGPPYDLTPDEVREYFNDFNIEMLIDESRDFEDREGNLHKTFQKVFKIKKRA